MSMLELFLDPLFRLPLLTGMAIALVLPLIGALLLLRDEWLAALGLAHLAAASALLGQALGLPAVLGAPLGALAGGAVKSCTGARGNLVYGFMILFGWSALFLIAANTRLGATLGHALVDGQLYFAGVPELIAALALAGLAAAALPRLVPRLLRARFFPHDETANRLPAHRWHLSFDLLSALAMALGTATVGLMGAFALVLVPAWIAFRVAPGWTWTLVLCALIGVGGSLMAYLAALTWDQPFGPVLVAVLIGLAATVEAGRGLIGRMLRARLRELR